MPEYFPPPTADCPTFDADSEWHPIIDGAPYFAALHEQLTGLGAGDEVLIGGLGLDPDLRLVDGSPHLPEQLAALAADGVDVRLLLAGKVSAFFAPFPGLAGFRSNAKVCREFNALPGQAGHALIDYSGPRLGSNHQKTVVITRGGEVTAFVGGIDLEVPRKDAAPHDTLRLKGNRWGWHDIVVRLRGPAAARAHDVLVRRWHEAATLPVRPSLRLSRHPLPPINPPAAPTPDVAREQKPAPAEVAAQTSVRVLRSISDTKLASIVPGRGASWDALPARGVQEIFDTVSHAISRARRYVYLEDQYLHEYTGGRDGFELYPYLRDAAARGVKVMLVGSGRRDPEDPGPSQLAINKVVNKDLRTKLIDRLDPERRGNVVVYRVEHCTVHAKLLLVDDVYANIGSANLFSRSMAGVDCEISSSVETATTLVRDLRVKVWAEHLRCELTPELALDLGDLDRSLGVWNAAWLPADVPATTWRVAGEPASFAPAEWVLSRVDGR
ncbi:phospholipase D-like domain-containing protein [Jatrophihabitans fulvus]